MKSLSDRCVMLEFTCLDNEPLGRATTAPLYQERYQLVTSAGNQYPGRQTVSWKEASELPPCLLTSDLQNRRIINHHLTEVGTAAHPMLESDSMIALFSHDRAGKWAGIMPRTLIEAFGPWETIKTARSSSRKLRIRSD